jgi:hypothetical protein
MAVEKVLQNRTAKPAYANMAVLQNATGSPA